ncbi:MAG TPA: cupin domain-containing protein [Phycisphaerae bacterium]|nr:cupin domain-containing protein [Phycisphaerae bacterium]
MEIKRADDVPAETVEMQGAEGVRIRLLIHEAQGAPSFFMRQFTVAPGGRTPEHTHAWEHEVYILAGRGTAVTPDGEKPFAAGDCVYVAPHDNHQFRNTGPDELKFLCLIPKT